MAVKPGAEEEEEDTDLMRSQEDLIVCVSHRGNRGDQDEKQCNLGLQASSVYSRLYLSSIQGLLTMRPI
jgi:hypothetical protein